MIVEAVMKVHTITRLKGNGTFLGSRLILVKMASMLNEVPMWCVSKGILPHLQLVCSTVRYLMIRELARASMLESTHMIKVNMYSCKFHASLYILVTGSPHISALDFNIETQTFTCFSSGGPATTVTWMRNNELVEAKYSQHQRIVNTLTAEYQSILMLGSEVPDSVVGKYSCTISNARGNSKIELHLKGMVWWFSLLTHSS